MANSNSIDFEQAREYMVERQVRTWEVLDQRVLDVMRAMPREAFVPADFRNLAYADANISLAPFRAEGEEMMQPKVEGRLLQALDIGDGDNILEIGTGSGYLTALLARLGNKVTSVDINEALTAQAGDTLQAQGIDNITLESRDAATLDGIGKQYDCVAVTGSMPRLHDSFRQALKVGGRLFVIIGSGPMMEAQLHTRVTQDFWQVDSLFDTRIAPLKNAWNPKTFVL
ncbi:MAG: protein-L-isoaspartate O-methyltransferase [Gammaproteobacteria bacterium]|nr:protein-L-isoaspartate O-methyltransferase [Gammaproteobacteria bacterium]